MAKSPRVAVGERVIAAARAQASKLDAPLWRAPGVNLRALRYRFRGPDRLFERGESRAQLICRALLLRYALGFAPQQYRPRKFAKQFVRRCLRFAATAKKFLLSSLV